MKGRADGEDELTRDRSWPQAKDRMVGVTIDHAALHVGCRLTNKRTFSGHIHWIVEGGRITCERNCCKTMEY